MLDTLAGDTTVLPFGAPYTRFNGRLGHERAVAAGSWATDRIHAVQQATGVTGNDVRHRGGRPGCCAAGCTTTGNCPEQSLVGRLPDHGARPRARDENDQHGNMFGLWLCPLGTDLDDPAERLDLIHRSMSEGKQWVASRGSAASLLLSRRASPRRCWSAAAVYAEDPYRIQRADFACSRPADRNVLERRACRGDLSGVDGLRRPWR